MDLMSESVSTSKFMEGLLNAMRRSMENSEENVCKETSFKAPLVLDEKIVWFYDTGPECGIVKWIGKLKEMGDDWVAGIELDNPVGNNDGNWAGQQLFTCKPKHGLVISVNGLMREKEYFAEILHSDKDDLFEEPVTTVADGVSGYKDLSFGDGVSMKSELKIEEQQLQKTCPDLIPKNIFSEEPTTVKINMLSRQLELAITNGMTDEAAFYAKQLADWKVNCKVRRMKAQPSGRANEIRINLFVEDRDNHVGPIMLYVNPDLTIEQLKEKIEEDYEFPACMQKWIFGTILATDNNATISSFGVTSNGYTVFLYLTDQEPYITLAYMSKLKTYFDAVENISDITKQDENINGVTKQDENILEHFQEEDLRASHAIHSTVDIVQDNLLNIEDIEDPNLLAQITENEEREKMQGWQCPECTLINPLNRPGCSMCAASRPENCKIPDEIRQKEELELKEMQEALEKEQERVRQENYEDYLKHVNLNLVPNEVGFECLICYSDILPGEGVILRECLHTFCKNCVSDHIEVSETAEVTCPFRDEYYSCPMVLQEQEIRALVSPEVFEKHLQKGLAIAENQSENSFHCKTANCRGWCLYDDNVNEFLCPICNYRNCLTCKAQHEGQNCQQFQQQMELEAGTNENFRKTKEAFNAMLANGDAMHCPKCKIIITKKSGCDWMICSMCKTEICWVTKGARWGPQGNGDTSGGCRCKVNGPCHPRCGNCH